MEKRVLVGLLVIFLFLTTFPFLHAQIDPDEEKEKVDNAYECLEDKVEGQCSSLSTEEKIFSLWAIDECQAELLADSSNDGECWPDGNCRIKTTAQAVLALDNTGVNVDKAKDWLLSQNRTTTELTWYLEIESPEETRCSIDYSGSSYSVDIGEDKKISNNAGSCLILAQDDYWLRVPPSCYNVEFAISCDQSFLTTLLFRKSTSPTIHVLQETSSASADGTTTEIVESSCFAEGNVCDYEGSLWAALVLDSLDEDISAYLPYLITLAEDNDRFLPESFLYFITSELEYRTDLLLKQKSNKWWMESGDKFYDTALALYPFQPETLQEKINSKEWLLSVQDPNSCWENNVRNTAFILASIWPRTFGGGGDGGDGGLPSCEGAGYYCVSTGSCDRQILSEFDCPSLFKCCSAPPAQETCAEVGGEICSSNEVCRQGTIVSTPDLSFGTSCCSGGYCEAVTQEPAECELNGGICRTYGCNDNEEESVYACEFSGDTCCVQKAEEGRSYLWIWILFILIVLVVAGIIFRDKLRAFWLRAKSRFGKSRPGPGPPHRPGPRPPPHHRPMRRFIPERRILLPAPGPPPRRPARVGKSRSQKELDDVLKKLKSMGK
jgi:hypothetical protein